MFYRFNENGFEEIKPQDITENTITAGYVDASELEELNKIFGFAESTVEACKNANELFRTGVEVHRDYTFTELRIMNGRSEHEDCIALYLKRNFILVVDIADYDGSTRSKYMSAVEKYPPYRVNCEKILASFIDSLLSGDHTVLETIGNELDDAEEELLKKDVDKDFNMNLLRQKKQLSKMYTYYAQLLDIAEAVCENDNDIFHEDDLIYIDNVSKRIGRLREETASLKSTVEHLQDAYSSYLDVKMNSTMKIFTVLTSIFFPLTIIVGWYGMNFQYMPEFAWKYGYVYVIVLSVVVVLLFALIGKKKKWF